MNRREQLTLDLREDIGSAILQLMREKPLDKITVDDFQKRRMSDGRHSTGSFIQDRKPSPGSLIENGSAMQRNIS